MYTKSTINAGTDIPTYLDAELGKIQNELKVPEFQGIAFEMTKVLPTRFKVGDLYYGAAGVFGASEGLYIREASSWRKL